MEPMQQHSNLPGRNATFTDAPLIVVGGGAAGLMAAGQAALAGARVVVLEKMRRPGRKLCITGKGRPLSPPSLSPLFHPGAARFLLGTGTGHNH
jgi:flavin-dependent dehydrogenase